MITPYKLVGRRETKAQATAVSLVARAFSAAAADRLTPTAARLSRDLRVPVALRHLRVASEPPFASTAHMVHAHFAAGPDEWPAVLELDNRTALEIVDRLLGGDGTSPLLGTVLSPVQRGLLSYVLLRALDAACPETDFPVMLINVTSAARSTNPDLARPHVGVVWSLSLAGRESLVRWRLPLGLPRRVISPLSRRLLAAFPVVAHLEVVRLPMSASSLAALRVGDVVVVGLPTSGVSPLAVDSWAGDATVSLGRKSAPAFSGRATRAAATGFWRFAIDRIMLPMESTPTSDSESRPAAAISDDSTAALLDHIPVTLAVEIARVEMSAAAVAALQVGETILLGRNPGDPLTLAANGALIGTGELVDVDGELGVRVTRLDR